MTNCCDISNSLIRDGASQRQRQVTALSPDFVQVDEQDLADFLVFAYQLSKQIIYYKANGQLDDNEPDGDWQEFFKNSTPVQIALISKTRTQVVRDNYNQQLKVFLADRTPTNLVNVLATWQDIFEQIQQWYQGLESDTPLKGIIKGLVNTNLQQPLMQMQFLELLLDLPPRRRFNSSNFVRVFEFRLDNESVPDRIPQSDTHFELRAELDDVFQVLFQNYRQIIQLAPEYLLPSLTRQDLQPHLALYLGFWELLKPARDDLNRMTQRHLDFFYRKVLRLPEKQAIPDLAHLIFELAKFQQEYKLDLGTTFKADKDAKGVELFYELNEEIVVHKAQITSLKGLFLASRETGTGKPISLTGLHASLVANSADGKGEAFPKDQLVKVWPPFGDATRPQAAIGLAIASNLLLLQEGNRTITIRLDLREKISDLAEADLPNFFQIRVSGEKDWIKAQIQSVTRELLTLTLQVKILIDQPAVVPYHAALTNPTLPDIQQPVLLLQINTDDSGKIDGLSPYHFLLALNVTKLTLTVDVDAVHNLLVQNDLAVLDASKPFQPFGSQPKVGANFYIGSQEVFQKPISKLTIRFDLEKKPPQKSNGSQDLNWLDIYAAYGIEATSFNPGQLKVQALRQKVWNPTNSEIEVNLFDSQPILLDDQLENLKLQTFVDIEHSESWTPQTQHGFLRLQLTGDSFLHDQYATVLTRQLLAAATSEIIQVPNASGRGRSPKRKAVIGAIYRLSDKTLFTGGSDNLYYVEPTAEPLIPQEPYTPFITALSLGYTAQADYTPVSTTDKTQRPDIQLFHLYPFDGFSVIAESLPVSLLPSYVDEGTLYIGIQDLDPPTALPLLFQVAEETANTDLPRAKVQWYYLANNTWQAFEEHQIVSDGTNGLIKSGIVNLAIPAGINTGNTLLDPSLYWIKVAVADRSGAICNIVGVHTQAAQVTFRDRGNDPAHLAAPLPAGAINKLEDPQPEVSKIKQPYDSFGGRVRENPSNYYTRISEQLRHKGRAITIFDYERLVLEQFPAIYKVRCINHSRVNDQDKLQELVPGSVTLAVIPDLSRHSTTNDLEPKVNINLLAEIADYLRELSSPWVDIRVVNPHYEAIWVEFQVQFKAPYQANFDFYQRELQRGIISFLSPWTVKSGAEIHFGGKVYRSSILNFVEEQPYVDFVVNFQMHQAQQRNLQKIVSSSARSILVSVPFGGHIIRAVGTCPPNQSLNLEGLGYQSLDQLQLE